MFKIFLVVRFCSDEGILVTGDTVYATDSELIDWYPPGSSCHAMAKSVLRILDLASSENQVKLALPGHNDILSREELQQACINHLKSSGKWRVSRKAVSRQRARLILAANAKYPIIPPGLTAEWIKH